MQIDRAFAVRFKLARTAENLTYSEIARQLTQSGHPISPQGVRQWEHPTDEKVVAPRPHRMRALAKILKVEFEWLAFGGGEMRSGSGGRPPVREVVPAPGWQERQALTHAWLGAIQAKIPEAYRANLDPGPIQIGGWRADFDYRSSRLVAELQLLDPARPPHLAGAQRTLWRLLIASRLLRCEGLLLICTSSDQALDRATERILQGLAWESQTVGLHLQLCRRPDEAATTLARFETHPESAEPDFVFDDEVDEVDEGA